MALNVMAGTLPTIQVLALASRSGDWTAHSLELLGDASALARRLGGRVGAWVLPPFPEEGMLGELAAYGCDVAHLLRHPRLEAWAGEMVASALAGDLPDGCRAVLLPGDARGEEVAAWLGGRTGWEWVPDVLTLSATRAGVLELAAALPGGKLSRAYRTAGSEPVILTIREGVGESLRLDKPRALERREVVPALEEVTELTRIAEFLPADPKTQDIRVARRIVSGGRGVGGPEGMALVGSLGDSLDASLAASRVAVDLGWVPAERQVGQTGKQVRPDLYVACGISGASHHVAGMRESRHIIAINPDPTAPIHEIAHLSLRADLFTVVPAIRDRIERRRRGKGDSA